MIPTARAAATASVQEMAQESEAEAVAASAQVRAVEQAGGVLTPGTAAQQNPACIYCPNAEFSDDAVKAKLQGTVVLSIVVTPDGRATDIHVSKGVGLGLDAKAVEKVRTWKIKPALGPDGKPAAVRLNIEVVF